MEKVSLLLPFFFLCAEMLSWRFFLKTTDVSSSSMQMIYFLIQTWSGYQSMSRGSRIIPSSHCKQQWPHPLCCSGICQRQLPLVWLLHAYTHRDSCTQLDGPLKWICMWIWGMQWVMFSSDGNWRCPFAKSTRPTAEEDSQSWPGCDQ